MMTFLLDGMSQLFEEIDSCTFLDQCPSERSEKKDGVFLWFQTRRGCRVSQTRRTRKKNQGEKREERI